AQSFVATMVRTIFAQPDAVTVHEQHRRIVEQLQARFPDAASLLDEAAVDLLAFTGFPKEHWRQLWSNNSLERLNKEIRRRTDVLAIFLRVFLVCDAVVSTGSGAMGDSESSCRACVL